MLVLAVAATKGDNAVTCEGRNRQEPLAAETLLVDDRDLVPSTKI